MEERIKFNVSRSITRTSVFPVLKREERIKKIKTHLAHFNNYHRNSDLGFLQISPHLTQVMYLFIILSFIFNCFKFIILLFFR
jgi:hypothetical protein